MLDVTGPGAGLKEAPVMGDQARQGCSSPLGQSRAGGLEGTWEPWRACEQERDMSKLVRNTL